MHNLSKATHTHTYTHTLPSIASFCVPTINLMADDLYLHTRLIPLRSARVHTCVCLYLSVSFSRVQSAILFAVSCSGLPFERLKGVIRTLILLLWCCFDSSVLIYLLTWLCVCEWRACWVELWMFRWNLSLCHDINFCCLQREWERKREEIFCCLRGEVRDSLSNRKSIFSFAAWEKEDFFVANREKKNMLLIDFILFFSMKDKRMIVVIIFLLLNVKISVIFVCFFVY